MLRNKIVLLLGLLLAIPLYAQDLNVERPTRGGNPLDFPRRARRTPRPTPTKTPTQTPKPKDKKKDSAPKKTKDGKLIIEFTEGDIKNLIKEFSELLQKNFTYDDTIRGKVTLIGPKEVTKWEAKKVFETSLQMMGYTVIWGWPINKIVPVSRAKTQGNVRVIY